MADTKQIVFDNDEKGDVVGCGASGPCCQVFQENQPKDPENISIDQSLKQIQVDTQQMDCSYNKLNQYQINEPLQFPRISATKFYINDEGESPNDQLSNSVIDYLVKQRTILNDQDQIGVEENGKNQENLPHFNHSISRDIINEEYSKRASKISLAAKRNSQNPSYSFSKSLKSNNKLSMPSFSCKYFQLNNQNPLMIDKPPRTQKQIWKQGFLIILGYVNRSIMKFKKTLFFHRPNYLSRIQLDLVGDKASNYQNNQGYDVDLIRAQLQRDAAWKKRFGISNVKKLKLLRKRILNQYVCISLMVTFVFDCLRKLAVFFERKLPIFDPFSILYASWEVLVCLVNTFQIIMIPIAVCFFNSIQQYETLYQFIYLINPIILIADMAVQANTYFYDKEYPVTKHYDIFMQYITSNFLLDLLTIINVILGGSQGSDDGEGNIKALALIFLLRLFYLNKNIITIINQQVVLDKNVLAIMKLIYAGFKTLFVAHLFACGWFSLGLYEQSEHIHESWLIENNLQGADVTTKYIHSLFAVCQNDYGKVESTLEKLFLVGQMLLQLFFIIYLFSNINEIYSEFNAGQKEYHKKLESIIYCLDKHQISKPLRLRVMKHLEYQLGEDISKRYLLNHNISGLQKYLKEEVQQEVNMKIINHVPLLTNNFNPEFIKLLSLKMTEQVYSPQQLIVKSQSVEEPGIFIITQGEAEIIIEKGQGQHRVVYTLRKLRQYDTFGQLEFFTQNQLAQLSVRSSGVTIVHKIGLRDFLELCTEDSDEREIYSYLKDCVVLNKDYAKIGVCCMGCFDSKHTVLECPYFFYGEIKGPILKRVGQRIDKIILSYKRNHKRKRQSAITIHKELEDKRIIFVQNNINFLLNSDLYNLTDDSNDDEDDSTFRSSNSPLSQFIEEEPEISDILLDDNETLRRQVDLDMHQNLNLVSREVIQNQEQNGKAWRPCGTGSNISIINNAPNSSIQQISLINAAQSLINVDSSINKHQIQKNISPREVADVISYNLDKDTPQMISNRSNSLSRQICSDIKPSISEIENQISINQRINSDSLIELQRHNKKQQQQNKELIQQSNSQNQLNQSSFNEGSHQDGMVQADSQIQVACGSSSYHSLSNLTSKQSQPKNKHSRMFQDYPQQPDVNTVNNIYNSSRWTEKHNSESKLLTQTYFENKMQFYHDKQFMQNVQVFEINDNLWPGCTMKSFKKYFPMNNLDKVILKYNRSQKKRKSERKIHSSKAIIKVLHQSGNKA